MATAPNQVNTGSATSTQPAESAQKTPFGGGFGSLNPSTSNTQPDLLSTTTGSALGSSSNTARSENPRDTSVFIPEHGDASNSNDNEAAIRKMKERENDPNNPFAGLPRISHSGDEGESGEGGPANVDDENMGAVDPAQEASDKRTQDALQKQGARAAKAQKVMPEQMKQEQRKFWGWVKTWWSSVPSDEQKREIQAMNARCEASGCPELAFPFDGIHELANGLVSACVAVGGNDFDNEGQVNSVIVATNTYLAMLNQHGVPIEVATADDVRKRLKHLLMDAGKYPDRITDADKVLKQLGEDPEKLRRPVANGSANTGGPSAHSGPAQPIPQPAPLAHFTERIKTAGTIAWAQEMNTGVRLLLNMGTQVHPFHRMFAGSDFGMGRGDAEELGPMADREVRVLDKHLSKLRAWNIRTLDIVQQDTDTSSSKPPLWYLVSFCGTSEFDKQKFYQEELEGKQQWLTKSQLARLVRPKQLQEVTVSALRHRNEIRKRLAEARRTACHPDDLHQLSEAERLNLPHLNPDSTTLHPGFGDVIEMDSMFNQLAIDMAEPVRRDRGTALQTPVRIKPDGRVVVAPASNEAANEAFRGKEGELETRFQRIEQQQQTMQEKQQEVVSKLGQMQEVAKKQTDMFQTILERFDALALRSQAVTA